MIKRSASALLLIALSAITCAQEITFNASVDRNSVATGDPIKFTLALNNAPMGSTYAPPNFGGLSVEQGPMMSTSSMNMNGRVSSTTTITYVLVATQAGDYVIGASTAQIRGGTIQTQPIKVHVVKGETTGPNSALLDQVQKKDPNLFCAISVSKTKAYVGEQVIVSYLLYSRYGSLQRDKYDLPKLQGCWVEEIDLGETGFEKGQVTVNGLRYSLATLKKQVIFPQKGGKLRIDPMTLGFYVNASFFSSGTLITIKSNPAEIDVMDLPDGKPADFIGAVGDLQMEVKAANTSVKANEAIDLNIKFSGHANLKLIDAPKLDFPGDFESYDPKITDHVTVNGGGMNGSREFQYLVIPRHEGDYTVGPLTYSYFDPASGKYKQLQGEALNFHVEKGDGGPGATISSGPRKSDVKQLDHDIRYIRTGDLDLEPRGHHLFGSWPYVAGMSAPALGFLIFFGWHRRREKLMGDVQGLRRRGADRIAKQRLKDAEEALRKNDRESFYAALGKALEGYFADKFNLGVAEVSGQSVREKLGSIDNGKIADEYAALMDDCATARFAPFENKPRQQSYDEAASLIRRIEDQL